MFGYVCILLEYLSDVGIMWLVWVGGVGLFEVVVGWCVIDVFDFFVVWCLEVEV